MEPYDNGWKQIIRGHLFDFLAFFFPKVFKQVDTSVEPQFLDKELQKFLPHSDSGKRYADLLVQVRFNDGQSSVLLCHIEIQQTPEKKLAERLFQYSYRIFDRLGKYPITLALLTDQAQRFRPASLEILAAGLPVIQFRFYTAKLLDYGEDQFSDKDCLGKPLCHGS